MSFQVIKNIKLNLLRPELTVVHGKQYDNEARIVVAQLFEDNTKWYAPENTLGVISYIKPDGNYGFYDETDLGNPAVIFDENDRSIVTLVLSTQTLTCAGKVKVEVNFYDQQQAERLSSFAFTLDVEKSTITQDDLTSSSEFRVLAEQITQVLTAAANLSGLEVDAETVTPSTAADATVTGGTQGVPYHIHFKIPQGAKGDKGDRGYTFSTVRRKSGDGTAGTVDKYELVLEDDTVVIGELSVYNGADGQGAPSSTTPKMDGNATAGVENGYSRGDHIHPKDTSKADAAAVINNVIEVTLEDVANNNRNFNVTGVTAAHKLVVNGAAYLSNPAAVGSDLTVTTGSGTITIGGTLNGTTDITMVLGIISNIQTA